MRLATRIFLCYAAIFVVCLSYPVIWTLDSIRTRYLEGVEDAMVDQANILASWVGVQMETGRFRPEELASLFDEVRQRPLSARIYSFTKTEVDMQIYLTDAAGRVVFHSADPAEVGRDYGNWRDVQLTLQGQYGARSTRKSPKDRSTSVLHVAAPIMVKGTNAGVLTVVKPTTTINNLFASARPQLLLVFGVFTAAAIVLSLLVSLWMTNPISRLTRYADDVSNGNRAPFPNLDGSEIGTMGRAFERMQEALEGKNYVESYVQTLTHEIKSPLSAIRGAAELLEEKMAPEQQARFLGNIRTEAGRIQDIVDRMLELSTLENLKILEKREKVVAGSLVRAALEGKEAILSRKNIELVTEISSEGVMEGEPFLLRQALANLLQNAIDFTPDGGQIIFKGETSGGRMRFSIRDFGPGFPEFAEAKLFDKFFSLQRPDTGKKSTGLGLNFVREVAQLHQGEVEMQNVPEGGVLATLSIPCFRS